MLPRNLLVLSVQIWLALAPTPTTASKDVPAGMFSSAWYAGWHAEEFPLSAVSWSKYTQLTYAFAVSTPDPRKLALTEQDQAFLPKFVKEAHKHGVNASLALGGWTGSRFFSSNIATAENRTLFVGTVADLVETYNLDGIDFDWEYPNKQGIGCNIISSEDTPNFLAFLQELRQNPIASHITLSAAVTLAPFNDSTTPVPKPSADVSAFSSVLDFISIMNYDISSYYGDGGWASAPLDDSCREEKDRVGSALSAVNAWTSAGFPSQQIVLGVPAYAHSFNVKKDDAFVGNDSQTLLATPVFNASRSSIQLGDRWDGDLGTDVCGVTQGGVGGVFQFWGLIEEGYLTKNGTVNTSRGFVYRWDDCSQTPFVYNPAKGVMVSYDDARSFNAKAAFILEHNLKGWAMWEAAGDSDDILLNTLLSATKDADRARQSNSGGTATTGNSDPSPTSGAAALRPLLSWSAISLLTLASLAVI